MTIYLILNFINFNKKPYIVVVDGEPSSVATEQKLTGNLADQLQQEFKIFTDLGAYCDVNKEREILSKASTYQAPPDERKKIYDPSTRSMEYPENLYMPPSKPRVFKKPSFWKTMKDTLEGHS